MTPITLRHFRWPQPPCEIPCMGGSRTLDVPQLTPAEQTVREPADVDARAERVDLGRLAAAHGRPVMPMSGCVAGFVDRSHEVGYQLFS
jgi:hypothetical protein